jgi:ATP-dependent RNA helicase DDX49/DBP8
VAKTGSGKTLAFALPILETLSADPYGVYALVLTPTRELAFQISDQFKAVGVGMGLRTCVVVGGRDSVLQVRLFICVYNFVITVVTFPSEPSSGGIR